MAPERTVAGSASPGGLAFLTELVRRVTTRPYPWENRSSEALALYTAAYRWRDVVARALGYEWCDAEDHWCDPEENPVRVFFDSNDDPDVGLCKACSEVTERALLEQEWEPFSITDAQIREDEDLVAASL